MEKSDCKTAVVTVWTSNKDFAEQADLITQFGEKVSWLILMSPEQTENLNVVKDTHFGLDSDVVVAFVLVQSSLMTNVHDQKNIGDSTQNSEHTVDESSNKSDNNQCFLPYQENGNFTVDLGKICRSAMEETYCLMQVYKIRKSMNSSVVLCPLGIWDVNNGSSKCKRFVEIEKRVDFHELPLIFGKKEATKAINQDESSPDDDDGDADMDEFSSYFTMILNAKKTVVDFSKYGRKDDDGEWTDLLGAIVREEVDISFDSLSKTLERCSDMSFTHDIVKTTKNIYIQPEESNEFRDIFMAPFDKRLILCVVGSLWKPKLYGGQMMVLISLAFALLIYNSYSAFITSVLSVELSSIRNIDDLLKSDYEIGYAKNGYDEYYLRSMNLSQLNQIYLRGYLHNDIQNVSAGLLRATKGNYGFFASSQLARKQLLNISNYKCQFDIDEIQIKNTVDHMAFIVAKRSPYKKLINLSIVKMYETGVYKYIYSLIHPNLMDCRKPKTYQSARMADLSTAFSILLLGMVVGVLFLVGECLWERKRRIFVYFRKNIHIRK
ncbi:hypothetical protein JTB14_018644 [Gonioctena quinquepunctata]|nr:hypothetical protein JTB14_018644 [Gonioctena quinquepunctata]